MTIAEMKALKQQMGYSYAMISELSGVPLGTLQKIFSGETENPRYDTLQALEALFRTKAVGNILMQDSGYHAKAQGEYTVEDYCKLPEDKRVELIDGAFFDLAAPTMLHQRIVGELFWQINSFVKQDKRDCQIVLSPFDVQLDCDNKTMVKPDVGILCDDKKSRTWGIYGAPDFVAEITSPASRRRDYVIKMPKYMNAGVREYWIVDTSQQKVIVYFFESEAYPVIYGFEKSIPVNIFAHALRIDMEEIAVWTREFEEISNSRKMEEKENDFR